MNSLTTRVLKLALNQWISYYICKQCVDSFPGAVISRIHRRIHRMSISGSCVVAGSDFCEQMCSLPRSMRQICLKMIYIYAEYLMTWIWRLLRSISVYKSVLVVCSAFVLQNVLMQFWMASTLTVPDMPLSTHNSYRYFCSTRNSRAMAIIIKMTGPVPEKGGNYENSANLVVIWQRKQSQQGNVSKTTDYGGRVRPLQEYTMLHSNLECAPPHQQAS